MFERISTKFEDACLLKPMFNRDNRGFFTKQFEKNYYEELGLEANITEVFYSESKRNVVRGLHFQSKNPQIKYVQVISGSIMDVIVDLRFDSDTYLQWEAFDLSDKNNLVLYVPKGFAHGFRSLENNTIVQYMCVGKYEKSYDTGIYYNDISLKIDWGGGELLVGERDAGLNSLEEAIMKLNEDHSYE